MRRRWKKQRGEEGGSAEKESCGLEEEKKGKEERAPAFKKAADSIRAAIVIHGAPYRETNTPIQQQPA